MQKTTDLNAWYTSPLMRQKPLVVNMIVIKNIFLPPENNTILLKCLVFSQISHNKIHT
jgi:hypothetical protein